MLVVPVIDLLNGQVVRAIGGQRDAYQPWLSPIANYSRRLEDVLDGLCEVVFHHAIYVADLDAITGQRQAGAKPSYLDVLFSKTPYFLLDRGWADPACLSEFLAPLGAAARAIHPVLSTESIHCSDDLPEMVKICRSAGLHPVLSLDLKQGRPIASSDSWKHADPLEIVDCAVQAGLASVIVLDLFDVGKARGGTTIALCKAIHQRYPQLSLVAGGGIRSYDECCRYRDAGCNAVLVATALHTGCITRHDCDRLRSTGRELPFLSP